MKYVNDTVRRRDRLLDEQRACELLATSEYGVLSMTAPEGKKLRAIERHPAVSFCIVGRVNLLPDRFTTEYESVVFTGSARANLAPEERMHALELLVDKLSPDFKELGRKYSEKSFHRVQIIRIDFTEYSGKRKKVLWGMRDE